jgi:alkaline phosphatase D
MKKTTAFIILFAIVQMGFMQELDKIKRVPLDSIKDVDVIAFGSCNHQGLPQEMWLNMMDYKPDFFIFLGDNIYGDCKSVDCLSKKYNQQLRKTYFLDFMEKIPVLGTWDDHEYGTNNCGVENPFKKESQKLFLDFIGEPLTSPRRIQEGIYTSYTFGKEGKKVKVILLDERYFRDKPGENADMLGELQWKWFEKELNSSDAQINLIASSSQFLADRATTDRWAQYPKSQKRMYDIIRDSKKQGVIFLSGDIHCAEMSVNNSSDLNYPIYDFTSSGLTHSHLSAQIFKNKYKIQKATCNLNYGLITINWNNPVTIKVEMKDIQNFNLQEKTIYLDDLIAK